MNRIRYLLLPLIVAVALAGLPAPAAHAATVTEVAGQTSQTCDSTWKNCTPISTTTVAPGTITAQTVYGGPPTAFGCKWVNVWVTSNSPLGFVMYRYHQLASWCWAYGVIVYNQTSGAYMDSADGLHQLTGNYPVTYWYQYSPGWNQSGWYSTWHGQVSNCFWTACGGTQYPWVEIRAHGDGTYYRTWGGGT